VSLTTPDISERVERRLVLELLNDTIERAARECPYYAETFRGLDLRVETLDDLGRLPLLHRDDLVTRRADLFANGERPVSVGMTGGTTLGKGRASGPLLFFKSAVEVEAKQQLLAGLGARMRPRPLVLHLVNLAHGLDPHGGVEGCFQVPLERQYQFDAALCLLREVFAIDGFTPRVSIVAGALRLLKALTMLFIEQGVDGSVFAVTGIASSSNHLTSRWRTLLEQYWRAPVDDFYGMSEVPGLHAQRCASCGHFHCAGTVVTEVLALDRDDPIAAGVGRLIATSLYPLAAMMPIIRYDTGDLVELFPACAASDAHAIEFLGRQSDAIVLPHSDGTHAVVAPIVVNDVVDEFPDVAVTQLAFAQHLGVRTPIGFLKWRLAWQPEANTRTLVLTIEPRWPPAQFPAAARDLRERIRASLLARSAALAARVAAKDMDVAVALEEPGAMPLPAAV